MNPIAASELIVNSRGAIYHLNLRPEELAPTVITVGDPDRVKAVSRYFDRIEFTCQHREFITHTGYVGSKRITVLSSGIGPDNIDIVLNELDALANIDLVTRCPKEKATSLQIIRLGTSGSLQADIPVNSFVASTHGLGIDNLLHFYRFNQNEEESLLIQSFLTQTQLQHQTGLPYLSTASSSLLKHFVQNFHHGITVTCPGFYGPQGRVLRLGLNNPSLINRLTDFSYGAHRITNFEMETAAIYGLGRLMGHQCLALNVIVANRVTQTFSDNAPLYIDKLIQEFLTTFSASFP
ncbi:MAG: phosphorylase [Bacteroidetes bacterium]|nr:phosphorylase [Bacteroidota bacterium]